MATVVHVVQEFGVPSEAWLYDLVTHHREFDPIVATTKHLNQEEFPFQRVSTILPTITPATPAFVGWRLRRAIFGSRVSPPNPWRSSLRSLQADVFHAHFGPTGWRCIMSGCKPTVTSFYGFDIGLLPTATSWRRAYGSLFREGAAFIVEGPHMQSKLTALGAPPERTFVIPIIAGGLRMEWSPPRPTPTPRVLMAGRMVPKKGFVAGIKAFAHVLAEHPAAEMIVIGDGPDLEGVIAAAKEAGLQDEIHFAPFMPRKEYWQQMRIADVFLQPSITAPNGDSEGGAPTTLLDAQAAGCVIVTTSHADIPHVVADDGAYVAREGDLDDLIRCLNRALSEMGDWERRSFVGRSFIESQHSSNAVMASMERVYHSL